MPDQAKSRKDVVLITGSSGFIGRALGARLKERYRGHRSRRFRSAEVRPGDHQAGPHQASEIQKTLGEVAVAYMLDILTSIIGDQRRWRTMPWLVLLFGLLILPLGAVSVGFIIIQPILIGALCTLCMLQAVVTVILIPYSVDEVLATAQFLIRSKRIGRPFWRTLFKGEAGLSERQDEMQRLELPVGKMMREFLSGGVTYPWTLLASAAIGAVLLATPLIVGTEPPLYFSDHVVGCLAATIAISALAEAIRAVRLLNVPLGLWLAASPFLLDGGSTASMIADVVLGLALAALSLPRGARSKEHYGGWDRFIV